MKPTTKRIALMRMVCADEISYTRGHDGLTLWRRRTGQPLDEFLRGEDARLLAMMRAGLVEAYDRRYWIHSSSLPVKPTDDGRAWLAEHDR